METKDFSSLSNQRVRVQPPLRARNGTGRIWELPGEFVVSKAGAGGFEISHPLGYFDALGVAEIAQCTPEKARSRDGLSHYVLRLNSQRILEV